jgi:hypothetical protein
MKADSRIFWEYGLSRWIVVYADEEGVFEEVTARDEAEMAEQIVEATRLGLMPRKFNADFFESCAERQILSELQESAIRRTYYGYSVHVRMALHVIESRQQITKTETT